jgi:two-component system response regulator RstA
MLRSVLVVEDDAALSALVAGFLASSGWRVTIEGDGARAVGRILAERPDAVVLDWMLPGLDGPGVLRAVRGTYDGPIILVTARGDERDEVEGLADGADDYMAKPVRPRALLARLERLCQRHESTPPDPPPRLALDRQRRDVRVDGQPVLLTTAEFDLLCVLEAHAGEVVERDTLYRLLHGRPWDGVDRSVDLRVSRLRRKLEADGGPRVLKSVRAAGYLLVPT